MTYPNFKFSFQKSADFSCLFTFFQTRKENWQLFTIFWEFHMFWQKSDVCLNFQSNNKIDQKIFWTKMLTNLSAIWLLNKSPLDISTEFASLYINPKFYEKISQKNYAGHRQNWTLAKISWQECTNNFGNVQFCQWAA